ncbi:Protein CTR9 [Dionaea muscipula]
MASIRRFRIYEYPDYAHAFLRLAAIAKSRNDIQLSIELVGEALRVKEKCPNALSMLGSLELKNDEWVKAKETFRAASEAMGGNDSYASLCLVCVFFSICIFVYLGSVKGMQWLYIQLLTLERI